MRAQKNETGNPGRAAPCQPFRLRRYVAILRLSVLRCMPRIAAARERFPSARSSARAMNRRSNSRWASSYKMPLSTISSISLSSCSRTDVCLAWRSIDPPLPETGRSIA